MSGEITEQEVDMTPFHWEGERLNRLGEKTGTEGISLNFIWNFRRTKTHPQVGYGGNDSLL